MPTKILAIDDSKTMRLAIKITFAAEDADVTSVSKGSEAVARAKQMSADVVLVDASLAAGEPSGYEVCRALKLEPATAGIPVILLVSGQVGIDQAQLTAVGADDWLAKPFDTQELIDKVAAVRSKPVAKPTGAAAKPAAAAAKPAVAAAAAVSDDDASASQSGRRQRPENRTQMGMPSPTPPPRAAAATPAPTAQAAAKPAVAKPAISPASLAGKPAAQAAPATPAAPPPATKPAAAQAAAAKPAAATPAAAKPAVAATRPAAAGMSRPAAPAGGIAPGGPIPIAIPIPFTAADAPTPGMVDRLRQAAAAGGVDPRVAEVIASLSREVIEAIVWEVVPELAEGIIRKQVQSA